MKFNWFEKRRIYLDNAAATKTDPKVVLEMQPFWSDKYGNPGGIHKEGVEAKKALESARSKVARALSVKADEIIFLGSGTESNNLAIGGVFRLAEESGKLKEVHAITTKIEHPSVLDVFKNYEAKGAEVTYLDVDSDGLVSVNAVKSALRKNTILVSIMYVNSEIGTIEPISKVAQVIEWFNNENGTSILFHTDASQAPLFLNCMPHYLGVDLLTIDGQKINGPKGVGLLYKKNGVGLSAIINGGSQEGGLRPGTENVPLIVGLSVALADATAGYKELSDRVSDVRDYFLDEIEKKIPKAVINGSRKHRVANNINISIENVDGEFLVVYLDQNGISASTKSACLSRDSGSSYVVSALAREKDGTNLNPVRFTLGDETTKKDVDYAVGVILEFIQKFDRG
ncbi:MAG: cysteine desulfurase [Parcubacteria group bacterium]|nr:cysteine desulfurase [Parcubacteria group bacterium]